MGKIKKNRKKAIRVLRAARDSLREASEIAAALSSVLEEIRTEQRELRKIVETPKFVVYIDGPLSGSYRVQAGREPFRNKIIRPDSGAAFGVTGRTVIYYHVGTRGLDGFYSVSSEYRSGPDLPSRSEILKLRRIDVENREV